jgi:hypothetical protein
MLTNHVLSVDFFGAPVRCETQENLISLNDLFTAANIFRLQQGRPLFQLPAFLASKATQDYLQAASVEWGVPVSDLLRETRGTSKRPNRTMAHMAFALFAAEYLSPEFHARMHKELIEGRLMQWRNQGGTEFAALNAAIDAYLPGRGDKSSNLGVYIQIAKVIRAKVTGVADADYSVWNTAAAHQQQQRTRLETFLVDALTHGLVKDYAHLKMLATNYALRLS